MNKNELQVLIDYTKGMIADNKEPERKVIIALCNELERIADLNPVAWMYPSIGKPDCMVITKSAEESENIEIFFDSHGLPFKVIQLYRLDK